MTDAPEISVVCSTYSRAERLPGLFAALAAQTFGADRFEVVIVDDASVDNTRAVLDELATTSPLQVRVVGLDANRGRAGGRNVGWRAANAPIVAFTDDDCAPDPDWLQSGYDALAAGARIVVGPTQPNPAQADNSGAFSRTQRIGEASAKRYFQTCNIFYRRADLAALDGFDEAFSTKGGEDTDLGWRILDQGGDVAFAPDALVLHDVTVGTFAAALREASSWLDIPLVVARHPARARPLLVHRLFWKKTHELVLFGAGGVALAVLVRNPFPLLALLPWISFRVRKWPIVGDNWVGRVKYLPHALVIDVVEVTAMVRGSIRSRVFVL
jgi:GT2 family glycosyltransferase